MRTWVHTASNFQVLVGNGRSPIIQLSSARLQRFTKRPDSVRLEPSWAQAEPDSVSAEPWWARAEPDVFSKVCIHECVHGCIHVVGQNVRLLGREANAREVMAE